MLSETTLDLWSKTVVGFGFFILHGDTQSYEPVGRCCYLEVYDYRVTIIRISSNSLQD